MTQAAARFARFCFGSIRFRASHVQLWVWGVACLCLIGNAVPAFAQIAGDPLIQTGTLSLPTGAYSPLRDQAGRAYAFYESITATVQNKPTGSPTDNVTGSAAGAAVDLSASGAIVSLGGNTQHASATFDSFSPSASETADQTGVFLGVGIPLGEAAYIGATAAQFNVKRSLSQGAKSGSVSLAYTDIAAGFSANVANNVRIGAGFSPEVSAKANYDGSYTSTSSRAGHGAQMVGGIAYNAPTFSVGVDGYQYSEDVASYSDATSGAIVFGKLLLSPVLLSIAYDSYHSKQLVDGTNYVDPDTVGRRLTLGAAVVVETWVLGAQFAQSSTNSSDFGNAAADANRVDTTTEQAVEFTILKAF